MGAVVVFVVAIDAAPRDEARAEVTIVRERRGTLSFFVRRIEALDAEKAERRARWRAARGTRRLMTLLAEADWMV